MRLLLAAASLACAAAFLPAQNPPWPGSYAMNRSTITMACNSSGPFNLDLARNFAITSYDWSNEKEQWANAKPMDCEERMVAQAERTKAVHPSGRVFVYANLVKALPWMTTVREKLEDPAYSGFFLRFKEGGSFPNGSYHVPACTGSKCSAYYHDQEQTPQHPKGDGSCVDECDCGSLPCGEYLWDHRNGTMLRDFLVKEYVGGPQYVGHPAVSGLFVDDFWCSDSLNGTGACGDPVQGPSEINRNSQEDMGLTDGDVRALTEGWLETMTAAQAEVLRLGGYTWSLLPGESNANAEPRMLSAASCASTLRPACGDGPSPWESLPLLFGLHAGNKTDPLPQLGQDVAAFLLMRGPHAYAGWGQWGMSWPVGTSWQSKTGPFVPVPAVLRHDFGEPDGRCREASPGVFTRRFGHGDVSLDCNTFRATVPGYP